MPDSQTTASWNLYAMMKVVWSRFALRPQTSLSLPGVKSSRLAHLTVCCTGTCRQIPEWTTLAMKESTTLIEATSRNIHVD